MKLSLKTLLLTATVSAISLSAQADDMEGKIDAINAEAQSFVVQGITFFTETTTDYDDGLRTFADLKVGQNVEVDFEYRDKRHIATEIELEK